MNLYDLDTPSLIVDLDRLERNVQEMARIVTGNGKKLRPHTKTHKTIEIARMQLANGATGLTVAKLGEAEVYANAGFDDIFIANQIVGAIKVERLINLVRRIKIRAATDSVEATAPIAEAAEKADVTVSLLIEVDTGLGRAGVRSPQEALELAQYITSRKGVEFIGVFTHEGQVYGAESKLIGARAAQARLKEVCDLLTSSGIPVAEISMGSTPGAPYLALEPLPTELRPGTYVFNDRMQVRYGASPESTALTVLATVTSIRSDGRLILDAGSKSLAGDSPFADKTIGEVVGHPELTMVSFNEEHGYVQISGQTSLKVGDKVRIIPNHACTCLNMHDNLVAVRGETVEAVWKIAGRGKIQ